MVDIFTIVSGVYQPTYNVWGPYIVTLMEAGPDLSLPELEPGESWGPLLVEFTMDMVIQLSC